MDRQTAMKVSAGFGGGMGRMAGTCGAVTGAFMVLGLKHGGEDMEAREKAYRLVREFASQFEARHGSLLCKDLMGCDISTPEGMQATKDRGLRTGTALRSSGRPPRSWRRCYSQIMEVRLDCATAGKK